MIIKNYLNKLRETKSWYSFLRFFFIPIFNLIWIYVINLQGKILKIQYSKNLKNDYSEFYLQNNDKRILRDIPEFKEIIKTIELNLTEPFLDEMKNKISTINYEKGHYLHGGKNFFIDMYPYLNDDTKKRIVDFALTDFNLSIVTNYLKVMPIIGKISLNLNVPVPGAKEGGSMLWHKDDFGYKSLDLFLPLNEVNEDNGPFFFITKKNQLGVFHKLKNIKKNPLLGERNKVELDTFDKISDGNSQNFISKVGDGIFVDSFTCYHRGGYCKKKDRLMLRISYQTPDSIDIVGKDNVDGFRYFKEYKQDDSKIVNYKNYILFKRNKFFKIQNLLMKLYRAIHFKAEKLL